MTAAAVSLAIASVARMDFLPGPPVGRYVRFLLWSAPVLIAMAHDARRVYKDKLPEPVSLAQRRLVCHES